MSRSLMLSRSRPLFVNMSGSGRSTVLVLSFLLSTSLSIRLINLSSLTFFFLLYSSYSLKFCLHFLAYLSSYTCFPQPPPISVSVSLCLSLSLSLSLSLCLSLSLSNLNHLIIPPQQFDRSVLLVPLTNTADPIRVE